MGETKDVSINSSQFWASRCTIDGVIKPSDSRKVLIESLRLARLNWAQRKRSQDKDSSENDDVDFVGSHKMYRM